MAKIQRTELVQRIIDAFRISVNTDKSPNESMNMVQAIVDVTRPSTQILGNAVHASSSTATIFTASSTKKTYITGFQINWAKDATNDMVTGSNNLTVDVLVSGGRKNIYDGAVITLTAQTQQVYIQFKEPLLIDKGSTVRHTMSGYTVGLGCRATTVFGYEEEGY